MKYSYEWQGSSWGQGGQELVSKESSGFIFAGEKSFGLGFGLVGLGRMVAVGESSVWGGFGVGRLRCGEAPVWGSSGARVLLRGGGGAAISFHQC